MFRYMIIMPPDSNSKKVEEQLSVYTSRIPYERIISELPSKKEGFVPEYRVISIVTRNLGQVGSSILTQQMRKNNITGPKIPIEKYEVLIKAISDSSRLVTSPVIRSKMERELRELALRYS